MTSPTGKISKTVYITTDVKLIKSILSKDNIYDSISYDDSPDLKHFVPKGIWFVLKEGNDIAGLITLEPMNNVLWTPHIIIYKEYRGNGSEEWGKKVADYMRRRCGAKKFLAFTPYEPAKRYAEKMGFKYLTTLTESIKKDGVLLDQYVLELGEAPL